MKYLIALLTAVTGVMHILIGFNVLGGAGQTNLLLALNGIGYLVLLLMFWRASGNGGTSRWLLLVYALITLIGYFFIGAGFQGGTLPLVIKAIELLLVIMLLLYKGAQAYAPAPATSAARAGASAASTQAVDSAVRSAATSIDLTGGEDKGASGIATATESAEDVDTGAVEEAERLVKETAAAAADKVDDVKEAVEDVANEAGDTASDFVGGQVGAVRSGVAAIATDIENVAEDLEEKIGGVESESASTEAGSPTSEEDLISDLREYFQSFGHRAEYSKPIEYIEGIGAVYGQKLRGIGVNTVLDLVLGGATRRGRKNLVDQSGISNSLILTWVNHADLFRIKGVGQEYADLLEEAGVDTVVELAQRNPGNLHKRMIEINDEKSLVRRTPYASEVDSWVEQAKQLRRVVYY